MMKAVWKAIPLAALVSYSAGCDAIDRARSGGAAETDPRSDLILSLEAPGTVRPGADAAIRLSIRNAGDSTLVGVIAELVLPAWMEPGAPEPAGTPVTIVASGEGIKLSYPVSDPPLQPREQRTIVQRVRISDRSSEGIEYSPTRTVMARLTATDGSALGPSVQTDVVVGSDVADGGVEGDDGAGQPIVTADGAGPIRLGMTDEAVRQTAPGTRDTTWTAEGMAEQGTVVPLGEAEAVAEIVDGRVNRIFVQDRGLRTREGLGVGSSLEELRSAYGRGCVGTGEGRVVVWFPEKPGISFVVNAPPPAGEVRLEQLPASALVTELFVRRGTDGC